MLRPLKSIVLAAICLSFLAGHTAWGADPEIESLRRRIEALENELDALQRRRAVAAAAPAAEPDREQIAEIVREEMDKAAQPGDMRVYWKEGLRLDSLDSHFKLKIGGRVQADWGWIGADDDLEAAFGESEFIDGAEFRRARFYMSGDIYENVGYKLQIDWADNGVSIKDAYLTFKNLVPWGTVKAGHFKEPFGLEELTSSKYITFMERSLPIEAVAPSRNMGIQLSDHVMDDRMTYAVGVFSTGHTDENLEDGASITGRLTWLPYYEDKGRHLVHVGVAASHRSNTDSVRYRSRPEYHQTTRLVDTGSMAADDALLAGLEAAWVHGPFSLQGEYISAEVDRNPAGSVDVDGFYVQASYFLTGEHRPYKTSEGAFSRLKPKRNFDGKGNWGAWEVAARYSDVDLDDSDVQGGQMDKWTLGLNWYLNPNMRVMINCGDANVEGAKGGTTDGGAQMFGVRLQVDF